MPLPTHRVSIFKGIAAEEWSNDYLVVAANMTEAVSIAESLVTFERNMHSIDVLLKYYRVATMTVGDRLFRHTAINLQGLAPTAGAAAIPLFNTMRVDLPTADSDPARKYFRLPINEADIAGGTFISAALSYYNTRITTHLAPLITNGDIVTSKGNTVTAATIHPVVQMRQLHRRRRRVTP